MPGYTKLIFLAARAVRRLPPEQRRMVLKVATDQARRHGPTVARHIGTIAKNARRPR